MGNEDVHRAVGLFAGAMLLLVLCSCSLFKSEPEYVAVGGGGASSGSDCCGCDGAYFGEDWLWEETGERWALHWWNYNDWDGGACVGMVLCNYGPDDYEWEMMLKVSPGIRDVSFFSGAWMDFEGTTVNIAPMCGDDLPCGTAQEMAFCAEPHVELSKFFIDAEAVVYEDDDDDDDDDDDGFDPGSLQDTDGDCALLMTYRIAGESNGGDCLEMVLSNDSNAEIAVDYASITFSNEVVLTDFWGDAASADGTVVTLALPSLSSFWPTSSHHVTICIEDMVASSNEPLELDAVCF